MTGLTRHRSSRGPAIGKTRLRERGQTLVLTALAGLVLIGFTGFAIDAGRIYAAHADLTRAVDSAALAGAQELPNTARSVSQAEAYLKYNDSKAQPGGVTADATNLTVTVNGKRTVPMTFMKVLGFDSFDVSAKGVAGFGVVPMNVVMAIDRTGSMAWSCVGGVQDGSNCKMKAAIKAANSFVDQMLSGSIGSSKTALGLAPFTSCYNPPNSPYVPCVPTSSVISLTQNKTTLHNAINGLTANGGTNICDGVVKAKSVLTGSGQMTGSNRRDVLVLMTDGGNSWSDPGTDSTCRGTPNKSVSGHSDAAQSGECNPPMNSPVPQTPPGGEMDTKTYDQVKALKDSGVEVFVIAVGVCGGLSGTSTCNLGEIGTIPDSNRAHNLLKCLASSSPGTNDHYFETADANDLTNIFSEIARILAFRLVE